MLKEYSDVLTVDQLACILGIGVNSAYRMVNRQEIGCVRVGRRILIPKLCVVDYLNAARYTVSRR